MSGQLVYLKQESLRVIKDLRVSVSLFEHIINQIRHSQYEGSGALVFPLGFTPFNNIDKRER